MSSRRPGEDTRGIPSGTIEEVEAGIRRRVGGRVSDLRVVVRGDGLALQGRSRSHHVRQLAQQAAMELTELPIVANEIRV